MAISESNLTKGQVRKLNALRKSVGESLGEETFAKWLNKQKSGKNKVQPDPVADMISEALKPLARKNINLGRHGYAVKRAKGKGAAGLIVTRIEKAQ